MPASGGDAAPVTGGEDQGEDEMQGRKRSFLGGPGKPSKKLKGQAQPKNALMHLYELKPGSQYVFTRLFTELKLPISLYSGSYQSLFG